MTLTLNLIFTLLPNVDPFSCGADLMSSKAVEFVSFDLGTKLGRANPWRER